MPLTRTQNRFYTYTVSLYEPQPLAPRAGSMWAKDAAPNYELKAANVRAKYKGTPETDEARDEGRTKEANLFTRDIWYFAADQAIADTWIILMTGSAPNLPPHPYIGRVWIVQSNSLMAATQGRLNTNEQFVYALLSNVPGLSTAVKGES